MDVKKKRIPVKRHVSRPQALGVVDADRVHSDRPHVHSTSSIQCMLEKLDYYYCERSEDLGARAHRRAREGTAGDAQWRISLFLVIG